MRASVLPLLAAAVGAAADQLPDFVHSCTNVTFGNPMAPGLNGTDSPWIKAACLNDHDKFVCTWAATGDCVGVSDSGLVPQPNGNFHKDCYGCVLNNDRSILCWCPTADGMRPKGIHLNYVLENRNGTLGCFGVDFAQKPLVAGYDCDAIMAPKFMSLSKTGI